MEQNQEENKGQEENLNWEFKKKLNFVNILDQISDLTKQVVAKELEEINSKIHVLHSMGVLEDTEKFREYKEQLKKLKIEETKI